MAVSMGDVIETTTSAKETPHLYGDVEVSGQATAIIGDSYANIVNVYHNTVVTGPGPPSWLSTHPTWTIRQNRILDKYTLETLVTYQEGGRTDSRGTSSQAEYRWYRKEEIGGGLYAEVYREEQLDKDRVIAQRAVKILNRSFLRRLKIDYKRELNALIHLSQPEYRHMYIHFFGWYESQDKVHIAMEYAPYGDLNMHIGGGLDEKDVKNIGSQILEGLRVMHSMDFVHRDIKPANILVFQLGPSWHIKIGDFSITKNTLTQHTTLHTDIGTIGYKAPEVMGYFPFDKRSHYDAKCDIWSLSCLVLEALTGSAPFLDMHRFHLFCLNSDPSLTRGLLSNSEHSISATGQMFLQMCLTPNPSKRPDAEAASELMSKWYVPDSNAAEEEDQWPALVTDLPHEVEYIFLEDVMEHHRSMNKSRSSSSMGSPSSNPEETRELAEGNGWRQMTDEEIYAMEARQIERMMRDRERDMKASLRENDVPRAKDQAGIDLERSRGKH